MPSLPCRGAPMPSEGSRIRNGCLSPALLGGQKEGGNATSPLHSRGSPTASAWNKNRTGCLTVTSWHPKRGQKCYVNPLSSGVPIAKRGGQNERWPSHPCLHGGPKEGRSTMSPPHSRVSPMPARRVKSELVASPLPCREDQKKAEMLHLVCILREPRRQARVAKSDMIAPTPALSGGLKEGGNATSALHSRGSPTPSVGSKSRSGCLTHDLLAAQKRAEMLCHPCILGGPHRQAQGAQAKVLPDKGEQNEKRLPHPCLVGAQNRTEMLPHPCIIR